MPDLITRVALNPSPAVHLDFGGVLRAFRHTIAPYNDSNDFTTAAGGASINGAVRATANTKVIGQFAFGPGIGRYVGGLVPTPPSAPIRPSIRSVPGPGWLVSNSG